MHILVTGGAGFIGSNLCRALGAYPELRVTVLDDLSTGDPANLAGLDVELVEGSILDRALLQRVVPEVRSIVHLAALPSVPRSLLDPVTSWDVNATGSLYVLEAARSVGAHVVLSSSSSVYGATPELPKHEQLPTRPLSPYAASKLAGESLALAYAHSFGLDVLPFRFFNVYGPGQAAGHAYAAVIPCFLDRATRGQALSVYGDGEQSRDFTYVGTVVRVICEALTRRVTSTEPVNLAFGQDRRRAQGAGGATRGGPGGDARLVPSADCTPLEPHHVRQLASSLDVPGVEHGLRTREDRRVVEG